MGWPGVNAKSNAQATHAFCNLSKNNDFTAQSMCLDVRIGPKGLSVSGLTPQRFFIFSSHGESNRQVGAQEGGSARNEHAYEMTILAYIANPGFNRRDLARQLGVHHTTVANYIKEHLAEEPSNRLTVIQASTSVVMERLQRKLAAHVIRGEDGMEPMEILDRLLKYVAIGSKAVGEPEKHLHTIDLSDRIIEFGSGPPVIDMDPNEIIQDSEG